MREIIVTPVDIPGPLVVVPPRFEDARGRFSETWSRSALAAAGLDVDFVQDNQSLSRSAGTVRGLHYQAPPFAQAKLVSVIRGAVLDVAVDARRGSRHYGRHVAVELSEANGRQLFVPEGFLHGFITLSPDTYVAYKVTAPYSPVHDGAIRWDDADLAIDWGPAGANPILSDKDRAAPLFRDFQSPFEFTG